MHTNNNTNNDTTNDTNDNTNDTDTVNSKYNTDTTVRIILTGGISPRTGVCCPPAVLPVPARCGRGAEAAPDSGHQV